MLHAGRLRGAMARCRGAVRRVQCCRSVWSTPMTRRSVMTLPQWPELKASISAHYPNIQRIVADYEAAVENFRPSPKIDAKQVFANNHLRLSSIDVVGFDYDYTLCNYTDELPHLIYEIARDFMINKYRYPRGLSDLQFDPTFAIRGLTIDRKKGLLCKLSSHQKLSETSVYRGHRRLSREEIFSLYDSSRHVPMQYRDENMEPLNDLFSVAHACLFADVTQYFIDEGIEYEPAAVVEDIHNAIQHVHHSGRMHRAVAANLSEYIEPNGRLAPLLERLRSSGKKTFLCTNSSFVYVDAGLKYMVGDDWRSLFDVVLVSANKPDFYTSQRAFRAVDLVERQMEWRAVRELKPNHVYTQGSLHDLVRLTGWSGSRVLYIGDSLFSDLVEPSRMHGWRTGAIIRELEDEIHVQRTPEYQFLSFQITALEDLMRYIQNDLRNARVSETPEFVRSLVQIHEEVQHRMEQQINPNFGSVFRSANHPSQFAFSVQRYVDIYAARLENLLAYPLSFTFYPERLSLPHEQRWGLTHPLLPPSVEE